MDNFDFQNPTRIIFGKETEKQVGQEVAKLGKKVLLHYGGGSIKRIGLYDTIIASLKEQGIEYVELGGVKPNPRLAKVYEGIELCKKEGIDMILAVGGGSVIDSAKAIAMGAECEHDVWDFFVSDRQPQRALPVATVLTIPAAGSESSTGCVITKEEGMLKRAVNSEHIYPVFSILNPEMAYTLPENQIANGVTDILAHLMERYFTNTENVEFTDRLIESTMKTIINNAPIVLNENREDYDAWSQIMWAGAIAHNNLLNTGRVGDWASHGIEHELSGIYDIAHGAGLAIVFPAWMKFVKSRDRERFVQFAHRVLNIDVDFKNPDQTVKRGIQKIEAFFQMIGQPVRLSDIDIGTDRIEEMAKKCTDDDSHTVGQFVKLTSKDVAEILKLAQ